MLEEYFASSYSTLQRNERVKLAALFWNIVGAGMFIGGVAGAFFYEGRSFGACIDFPTSWRPHIRLFARAVTGATENKLSLAFLCAPCDV
jgi:hypothetical protein